MVLGTSDVRLIDMTRAFASVANRGVGVAPYAIRRVVTADGRLLYQHQDERGPRAGRALGRGGDDRLAAVRGADRHRPRGADRPSGRRQDRHHQSNKDGWFIGFSSGLTTGVWMGRDDAKPIGGLQGGTAPARAFHDFMVRAVARRPVENFETERADARLAARARGGSLGASADRARDRAVGRCRRQSARRSTPWRRSPAPSVRTAPAPIRDLEPVPGSNRAGRQPQQQQPPPRAAAAAAALSPPGRSASAAARAAAIRLARRRRRRCRNARTTAPRAA